MYIQKWAKGLHRSPPWAQNFGAKTANQPLRWRATNKQNTQIYQNTRAENSFLEMTFLLQRFYGIVEITPSCFVMTFNEQNEMLSGFTQTVSLFTSVQCTLYIIRAEQEIIPIETGKSHLINLFSKITQDENRSPFLKIVPPVAPAVGLSGFSVCLVEGKNGNWIFLCTESQKRDH